MGLLCMGHALPLDDPVKRPIEFIGRTLNDIRKATRYFMAASTTSIRFHVDSDTDRDNLIQLVALNTCISPTGLVSPTAQPITRMSHVQSPPPARTEPNFAPVLPAIATSLQPSVSLCRTPRLNDIIDEGFHFLEVAADMGEKKLPRASLDAYEKAHSHFSRAHQNMAQSKTQTILIEKCQEIQGIVTKLRQDLHSNSSMSERLYQLQDFVDTHQVERAKTMKSTNKSELEMRFAALKNEKNALPEDSLEARLHRLRGGGSFRECTSRGRFFIVCM